MVKQPFPELKLGYEKKIPQPRGELVKHPVPLKKTKKYIIEEATQT